MLYACQCCPNGCYMMLVHCYSMLYNGDRMWLQVSLFYRDHGTPSKLIHLLVLSLRLWPERGLNTIIAPAKGVSSHCANPVHHWTIGPQTYAQMPWLIDYSLSHYYCEHHFFGIFQILLYL